MDRAWLVRFLEEPAILHPNARMPILFPAGRAGFAERWLVAESLLGPSTQPDSPKPATPGDHRAGRQAFINQGCATCHLLPNCRCRIRQTWAAGRARPGRPADPGDPGSVPGQSPWTLSG